MYFQLFIFSLSCFALFTLSRLGLVLWQVARMRHSKGWLPVFLGGLRIDAHLIAACSAPAWLIAPWLDGSFLAQYITAFYFSLIWLIAVLLELSTPQFVLEYDTRPNRLYVQYLKHPREVGGMLWKGYKGVVLSTCLLVAATTYGALQLLAPPFPALFTGSLWLAPLLSLVSAVLLFGIIRGTLRHRPINPSTVAFCGDALINTLALNSFYSVLYAIYSIKNERSAVQAYGQLEFSTLLRHIRQHAHLAPTPTHPLLPTLHEQIPAHSPSQPKNIVLIVEESLGAQYVGNLGGLGLTPCLDKIASQGWNFTRAYATGTRSVRGLEAISAGFPPTLSDAAIRLPNAQTRFFTLAQLLNNQGYVSRFIYGGESHFDNMKSFFLGNGFTELHDQPTFQDPVFTGTWGVSDEDMFNRLHELLSSPTPNASPSLTLAFSVSNHSPWEYPSGRIKAEGEPARVENTIRYADWALGQFFDKAQKSDYWHKTLFLIVADHDARVGGKNRVPVRHFHIPAVIVGGGVQAQRDDRIISQIDLPVTLLSLAGIHSAHPMIGHDLCNPLSGGRALMQYGDNYGYLQGNHLVVLEPLRAATQWLYSAPETYQPTPLDPHLIEVAQAHALWPHWAYTHHAHSLPHLLHPSSSFTTSTTLFTDLTSDT